MVTGTTLNDSWRSVVGRRGNHTAVVDAADARAWTFADLWSRITGLAAALRGEGLAGGDRVALLSAGTSRHYLEAEQAVMLAGLVRVPLDPASRPEDLEVMLEHVDARMLLIEETAPAHLTAKAVELDLPVHWLGSGALERRIEGGAGPLPDGPKPDSLASLNFTGGTTGRPKAVELTHDNLAAVVRAVNRARPVTARDYLLNVRPLWPISGVLATIHLLGGAPLVLASQFDVERFPHLVSRWRPSHTSLVPTMLVRLLDHWEGRPPGLSSLRVIDIGAAATPSSRLEQAVAVLGPVFGAVYGLTEAPWTCYRPPHDLVDSNGDIVASVGRPVGEHRVLIEGPRGSRPAEEVGQITIEGRHVMRGYWRDPEATTEVLSERRLRTGDLGFLDRSGRLHIRGRRSEVIRSGGRSVDPGEVEAVILDHPAVIDAAVVGIPDDEWGERVAAAVVAAGGLTAADIQRWCLAALPSFKKPTRVFFVAGIPRSHYGKVVRPELRETLIRMQPATPPTPDSG